MRHAVLLVLALLLVSVLPNVLAARSCTPAAELACAEVSFTPQGFRQVRVTGTHSGEGLVMGLIVWDTFPVATCIGIGSCTSGATENLFSGCEGAIAITIAASGAASDRHTVCA